MSSASSLSAAGSVSLRSGNISAAGWIGSTERQDLGVSCLRGDLVASVMTCFSCPGCTKVERSAPFEPGPASNFLSGARHLFVGGFVQPQSLPEPVSRHRSNRIHWNKTGLGGRLRAPPAKAQG